jgi:Holliday junction resolvase hjc
MKKPQTKNESHVKAATKKLLDKHGWFWWMPPASQYGRSGLSDIMAVKTGMFMAIETKFGSNNPTPLQLGYLESIRAHDHFAFVVRETSLDALGRFLDYLDQSIAIAARGSVPSPEVGGPMLEALREMEGLAIKRGRNHAATSDLVSADTDMGHDDHND